MTLVQGELESRSDRLTGDPGAGLVREILERSGIVPWMTARLKDPRSPGDVIHDLASLIRTAVLLAAQGWRDHDDADALDVIFDVVDRARKSFCDVDMVRIDAGFRLPMAYAGCLRIMGRWCR